MGHMKVETSASVLGSPDETQYLEGSVTRHVLVKTSVRASSAEFPLAAGDVVNGLRQLVDAGEECFRESDGHSADAPLEKNGDTRKKPESHVLNNPTSIVWRGLMLDP